MYLYYIDIIDLAQALLSVACGQLRSPSQMSNA